MGKTVKQIDSELAALRAKEGALNKERAKVCLVEQQKKREEYSKYIGKLVWYKNSNAKVWKLGVLKRIIVDDWIYNKLQFVIENTDYIWNMVKVATLDDVKKAFYVEPKKETR